MKAEELRLGNYIKLMLNHEDYQIIQVTLKDLEMLYKKQTDCEPLPLTEEWFLKFGFKSIDKGDSDFIIYTDQEHNYYFQIDVRKNDGKYLILDNSFDDLRAFSMIDFTSVHQLQNIYYALTGVELSMS